MTKFILALCALLFAVPAQAATYRFDAYVERNEWICATSLLCEGDGWAYSKPATEYGALKGQTYTGHFELSGSNLNIAKVWLNAPQGTVQIARLAWSHYDRYEAFGSVIHYLDVDLVSGLGKYYYENDYTPYERVSSLRFSNISPVPLPASGSVLLAGLGVLVLRRRFQRAA